MYQILFIGTDSKSVISTSLNDREYNVIESINPAQAQEYLSEDIADLILYDWISADAIDIDFVKQLRSRAITKETPIILLSDHNTQEIKIAGLKAGANDYIYLPLCPGVLATTTRAWLTPTETSSHPDKIKFGLLCIDQTCHLATIADKAINLGPTEFRLLLFFVKNQNHAFNREQLIKNSWPGDSDIEIRTVDVHIRRLRKALEPHGYHNYLQTVRTIGYRFSNYAVKQK